MLKKLAPRDRLALMVAGIAVAVFLLAEFGLLPLYDLLHASTGGVEDKELTLRRDQRLVAGAGNLPALRAAADQDLKRAEVGLLESPSAPLANAEWQRIIRELADQKGVELISSEVLRTQGLSPDYSLVAGRALIRCRLDQLVDLLAAFGTSPKLLVATNLHVTPLTGDAQKRLQVEIAVAAPMRATKQKAAERGQGTEAR